MGSIQFLMLLREEDQILFRTACILLVGLIAGLTFAMIGKI
ncbi:MAG TPA: hypothetical protein VKR99_02940 [Candidatus Eremiobacteraceae bacterium]|nr:hypothetical protein [Candidatus Eremiobacteraceae bacterium]